MCFYKGPLSRALRGILYFDLIFPDLDIFLQKAFILIIDLLLCFYKRLVFRLSSMVNPIGDQRVISIWMMSRTILFTFILIYVP